jgi:cobalt-zinc-cadmium efflux system protein
MEAHHHHHHGHDEPHGATGHAHPHPHPHPEHPGGAHAHDGHKSLLWALAFTLAFAVVEVLAGLWSGSLTLLSDAGHMVTDSTALGLAALAAVFSRRPPSLRHTYGMVRLEILAALVNGLIMLGITIVIAMEAVSRLGHPQPVRGGAVMGVAALGLLVNIAVAWVLHRGEQTLNTRAALLHVLGDLLGSVAALVSGAVIFFTGWTTIDPLLSLMVAGLILVSAWRLLAEAVQVLMEGVPEHIRTEQVARDLAGIRGVSSVHDLHVWTLASGQVALSAHLDMAALDEWPRILLEARYRLQQRHGIGHATLQPETVDNQGSDIIRFHPRAP